MHDRYARGDFVTFTLGMFVANIFVWIEAGGPPLDLLRTKTWTNRGRNSIIEDVTFILVVIRGEPPSGKLALEL